MKFGGRLDRYVGWLFVKSYLAAFLLVVGLYLIIDMAGNLDEYLEPIKGKLTPSPFDVARFYVLRLPFLYLEMSPFVTLVAGLFTAAKMVRFNEVVAALGAGVSLRRVMLPVFLGASFLALGMFVLREWATEEIGSRRDALLDRLEKRRPFPVYEDFWITARDGRMVRIDEYHSGLAGDTEPMIVGLNVYAQGEGSRSISADRAWPLPPLKEGRWRLEGGRRFDAAAALQPRTTPEVLEELRFTPADVELHWKGRNHTLDLSFTEALTLLERDPDRFEYRTLFHYLLTFPLAGLVLLSVGLPFVLGQERGRAAERIAIGLFLCVAYFGMDLVTRTLGLDGLLGPIHAAWLPVVTFGSLGAVLSGSMRS